MKLHIIWALTQLGDSCKRTLPVIKCFHTGDESGELESKLLGPNEVQEIARLEPRILKVFGSEGYDGGERENEEAAADALMEEAGGERGISASEGGVVVEREAGGGRLVVPVRIGG